MFGVGASREIPPVTVEPELFDMAVTVEGA